MLKVLELFKGTGSISKYCEKHPDIYEVVSLDIDPKSNATITGDILDWDYETFPSGHFDIIWASPPCVEYSCLLYNCQKTRPRNLDLADSIVLRVLEIIGYYKPKVWFIENPQTGLLKTRNFIQGIPFYDVSYCKYGYDYRKNTRIWSNIKDFDAQMCKKDCGKMIGNRHARNIGKFAWGRQYMVKTLNERYSIPPNLVKALFDKAYENISINNIEDV